MNAVLHGRWLATTSNYCANVAYRNPLIRKRDLTMKTIYPLRISTRKEKVVTTIVNDLARTNRIGVAMRGTVAAYTPGAEKALTPKTWGHRTLVEHGAAVVIWGRAQAM